MSATLSPTMIEVLAYMRKHGNTIVRYPGGFWAKEEWAGPLGQSYATTTINALESRGEIEWTAFQQRGNGQGSFPIEARIIDK